jgi:hypothetical protein
LTFDEITVIVGRYKGTISRVSIACQKDNLSASEREIIAYVCMQHSVGVIPTDYPEREREHEKRKHGDESGDLGRRFERVDMNA